MSSWSYTDSTVTQDAPPAPSLCEVFPGQTLYGSSRYLVLDFIGEGQFGKVAKCRDIDTRATVAVKILKKRHAAERELAMLDAISVLDPIKSCVLHFYECFEDLGRTCLCFEMLDRSLEKLLEDREWMPLHLKEIRPITQQLLLALDSLNVLGIIHSDLKLDNIMLVNQQSEPFRVKLIDFGVSFRVSSIPLGLMVQPLGFRAPEVTLGLPLTQAIDMWGLGCVLVHLYLGDLVFSAGSDDETINPIVDLLDEPEDRLIRTGIVTQTSFMENERCQSPQWRVKTPDEHTEDTKEKLTHHESSRSCLDNLIDVYTTGDDTEYEDRKAFVSLLKQLLQLHARQRISAVQALRHPFVTMAHLEDGSSSYVTASQTLMSVCPVLDPPDGDPHSSADGAAAGQMFNGGAPDVTRHAPPAPSLCASQTSASVCSVEDPPDGATHSSNDEAQQTDFHTDGAPAAHMFNDGAPQTVFPPEGVVTVSEVKPRKREIVFVFLHCILCMTTHNTNMNYQAESRASSHQRIFIQIL